MGFSGSVEAVPAHLALGIAGHAVRVQGQQLAAKMMAGPAQLTQSDLQLLSFRYGMAVQQSMDGLVGGNKGQAVGQLESFLRERAAMTVGTQTQGRFVDQVQAQTGFHPLGRLAAPAQQEVPGSQAQVLGEQQPDADLIAGDFIRQQLPHLPLQTGGVGGCGALLRYGSLHLDILGRMGRVKGVEFFFAGRNRR